MLELKYHKELLKCVRCGACKALCPTYLTALDETMGARGRVALLHAIHNKGVIPQKKSYEILFSCMLCGACRNTCPTGIDIPETVYYARANLKDLHNRKRFLRKALNLSLVRLDIILPALQIFQKLFYPMLYKTGRLRYIPDIASPPFRNRMQVYKDTKRIGRIALFTGCSINYLYHRLGEALLNILLRIGYEVVILKGEVCCGAPLRSLGFEEEAVRFAKRNIELFNKVKVEAILCMCPTCTMTIKKQYPLLAGDSIEKILDVNEFFIKKDLISRLKTKRRLATYHDPCHLSYGLEIKSEPREILKGIKGLEYAEMADSDACCGFAGFFSLDFKELSKGIGRKKIENIHNTGADTLVTSCPGCMMQMEDLRRENGSEINILHMVEIIDEAMHG